jgi:hypothetical protein
MNGPLLNASRVLTALHMGPENLRFATDQKPLTWMFKMNDPSSRIMRVKLKLQECDYTTVYRKGKENGSSDGLSRVCSETEPEGAFVNGLKKEQLSCSSSTLQTCL